MRRTSGCIAWTVLPFDVVAIVVASILMGGFDWLSVVSGLFAGSFLWLLALLALFGGRGDSHDQ